MDQCGQAEKPTIFAKVKRKFQDLRWKTYMGCNSLWWRFLHLLRLGRLYSVTLCRLDIYRRFPDGRCMWCGNKHYKRLT